MAFWQQGLPVSISPAGCDSSALFSAGRQFDGNIGLLEGRNLIVIGDLWDRSRAPSRRSGADAGGRALADHDALFGQSDLRGWRHR